MRRTRVLLSIKPKYAHEILEGRKLFEFRRVLFQRAGVTCVVLYASNPERKVIGEFQVEEILSLSPRALWSITREHAGIGKTDFDRYFAGSTRAHAIKVKCVRRY